MKTALGIHETQEDADGVHRGRAGFQPAVPGILPGTSDVANFVQQDARASNDPRRAVSTDDRKTTPDAPGRIPGAAGRIPALPEAYSGAPQVFFDAIQ